MESLRGPNGLNAASGYSNPRQLVSSLVSALPAPPVGQQASNPLRDVSPEARNVFLTLYALFEKELLPALDLLDRGLVTRLKVSVPESSDGNNKPGKGSTLLLVRSAQQQNARNPAYEHVNYYEVRLDAWSCSCPAFTFSAFPLRLSSEPEANEPTSTSQEAECLVGGLSRGFDMPICKHLLACVLVEHCDMFSHFANEREVSMEEMAGWAAGWGD